MPRHLFDTGFLTATGVARLPISVGVYGAGGVPPTMVGDDPTLCYDDNLATNTIIRTTDNANYNFVRLDLGSAQSVYFVQVRLTGATTGFTKLSVYVSNTASLTNPVSGSAVAAAATASDPVLFDGSGAPVTGRYVYIAPNTIAGTGSAQIAEVIVFGMSSFSFGVLQSISVTAGYQSADLRTTAWQSRFPIDVAFHSGAILLDAKHVELEPGALARAMGCDPASGVSWTTLRPIATTYPTNQLLPVSGLFEGTDTSGKRMRLRCPKLYLPGAKLDFALGQFATEGLQLVAYMDSTALVASWEFET